VSNLYRNIYKLCTVHHKRWILALRQGKRDLLFARRVSHVVRALILLLFACQWLAPPPVFASTYTVTNTNDSGPGTLRQAIIDANNRSGADVINFNIPTSDPGYQLNTSGVWTIQPVTPFPSLTDDATYIYGDSQSTNQGDTNPVGPEIEIDGSQLSATAAVFLIESNLNTIATLAINGEVGTDTYTHPGTGVKIDSSVHDNHIVNCYIGMDAKGQFASPNGTGVELLNGASQNTLFADRIGGNRLDGIHIAGLGTDFNKVQSSLIGIGLNALPNGRHGIFVDNSPLGTTIGGSDNLRNVISNNANNGILVDNANLTTVSYNYIGTSASGDFDNGNGGYGVALQDGAKSNLIFGNVISGNNGHGVWISDNGTSSNSVQANTIGADVGLTKKIPNGQHGVAIYDGAASNLIGDTNDPSLGNIIVASAWTGVAIVNSSGNTLAHNAIGTDMSGAATNFGNSYYGVAMVGASNNTIGPSNIIARNTLDGVRVDGASALQNHITQNAIFSNGGKGIEDINGGNGEPFTPSIDQATCHLVQGLADSSSIVEVFSDQGDEGRIYEGSTTAGSPRGTFEWSGTLHGPNVTVTYITTQGDTSEFGVWKGACYYLFLPLQRH
jgi:hypothetical protein